MTASADHPHTDPGDGRTECDRCGKWVFPVIHSCKGVPVTARARARMGLAAAEDPTAAVRAAISSNPTPNPDRMRALVDFLNPDNAPPGEGRYVASVALELLALAYRAETADRRNP